MEPIFLNPNFNIESNPLEVLNAYLRDWPAIAVEERLWEVFRYAVLGGLQEKGTEGVAEGRLSAEEVASLFDQLMALVRALEALREGGSGARYWGLKDGGDGDV
jgi:hypothetical protein